MAVVRGRYLFGLGLGFEKNTFLCLSVKTDLGKFYKFIYTCRTKSLLCHTGFLENESKFLTWSTGGCWCTFSFMFNKMGILKFLYNFIRTLNILNELYFVSLASSVSIHRMAFHVSFWDLLGRLS